MRLTPILAAASLALGVTAAATSASASANLWQVSGFNIGCGGTLEGAFSTDATGRINGADMREIGGCTPGIYGNAAFEGVFGPGAIPYYNVSTNGFSISSSIDGDNLFLLFASDLVGGVGTVIDLVTTAQNGSFKLDGYGDFIEITSGRVTAISVPEPASWALILLGFGALGAGLRARRAGVALAA